ncbi:MAG: hypothetical protein N2114_06240 [Candidatus Goldbacteria bacterium]|nr:hypothetical protein [Candidatus Goldiibacteriota bacterium]
MNQNEVLKELKKIINKEFIPIFFILIVPPFSLLEGYGIKTINFCYKDIYYIIPVAIGFIVNILQKNSFNFYLFTILLIIWILKNIPLLFIDRYFDGNFIMLLISDCIILFFYLLISISFWNNDPYFISFYKSYNQSYIIIFKIFGIYFFIIVILLLILFIKIFLILKTSYG